MKIDNIFHKLIYNKVLAPPYQRGKGDVFLKMFINEPG